MHSTLLLGARSDSRRTGIGATPEITTREYYHDNHISAYEYRFIRLSVSPSLAKLRVVRALDGSNDLTAPTSKDVICDPAC